MESADVKTIQVKNVCLDENNEVIRAGSCVLYCVIDEDGQEIVQFIDESSLITIDCSQSQIVDPENIFTHEQRSEIRSTNFVSSSESLIVAVKSPSNPTTSNRKSALTIEHSVAGTSKIKKSCESAGSDSNNNLNQREIFDKDISTLLLDLYCKNFKNVGPMKKFKNQKETWESISQEISSNFDIVVTGEQCNNRFKRIKRTATEALDHNRKSGNNPRVIHFDDQLQKIKSLDDSFMPKVRFGIGISEVNEESTNKEKNNDFSDEDDDTRHKKRRTQKKSSKQSMADVIKETMELKEKNKMKRYEDKMQLWKKYFDDMVSKKNN